MPPLPAPTMTGKLPCWILALLSASLFVNRLERASMVKRSNAIYVMPPGCKRQMVSFFAKF